MIIAGGEKVGSSRRCNCHTSRISAPPFGTISVHTIHVEVLWLFGGLTMVSAEMPFCA